MRRKIHLLIIIAGVSILFFITTLIYYFFFTTKGSGTITKLALSKYVESEDIDIKSMNGSLSQKLTLQDIEVENPRGLPQGSILKIQKLEVYFTSFSLEGLNAEIFNSRLKLPNSDAIVFYGSYKDNSFDLNVYSRSVNVREIMDLIYENKALKNITGTIINFDVYVKGSFLNPEFTGSFQVEKLSRKDFSMGNCPGVFNLQLKDIKDELKLYGEVSLDGGVISGTKTAVINLMQSRILFDGNPKRPSLDLRGTSTVEGTKVNIVIKGTIDKPDLRLSSEPPLPQERLLIMLATGRGWKGAEGLLNKGYVSADLAKDFIDYFVFSGSGSKIAQILGISDISLIFEKQKKGVAVKKSISEKIEASYSVEQTQAEEGKATGAATQKIGGEYKVTEEITIGAEKELKHDSETDQMQDEQKTDDRVLFKYKKKF